jgi:hypothetical protein
VPKEGKSWQLKQSLVSTLRQDSRHDQAAESIDKLRSLKESDIFGDRSLSQISNRYAPRHEEIIRAEFEAMFQGLGSPRPVGDNIYSSDINSPSVGYPQYQLLARRRFVLPTATYWAVSPALGPALEHGRTEYFGLRCFG